MVTINIEKKDLFLLSAIMIFLIGIGYIIAYNPTGTGGNPSVMGHSIDEIDWSQEIPNNLNVQGYLEFGSGNIKLVHKTGTNPSCSKLTLTRRWISRFCDSGDSCDPHSCSTSTKWSVSAPTCNYEVDHLVCVEQTCTASSWTEAICLD